MVEEGGGGAGAASPIAAEILKLALDADEGKLDNEKIEFISGSIGKSVKISANSQRTD